MYDSNSKTFLEKQATETVQRLVVVGDVEREDK